MLLEKEKVWCCCHYFKIYGDEKKFTVSCLVARSYAVSMEEGGVNEVQWHWPGKPSRSRVHVLGTRSCLPNLSSPSCFLG